MKNITTLVEDIHKVLNGEVKPDQKDVEAFGQALAAMLVERLCKGGSAPELRMSNFGKPCERQLWYDVNAQDKAEPLPPEARLKFLYGDIIEHLMLFLAKLAGHDVKGEQDEINFNGVVGHRDCIIDGVLVDVKSANARSFARFRDGTLQYDDPFGYLDQLSLYLLGSKEDPDLLVKKQGAFLAVDKELGNIALDMHKIKEVDYEKEVLRKRGVLAEDTPPPRHYNPVPHNKGGNEQLDMPCRYCAFKRECWSNANNGEGLRQYNYASGPVWMTKVVKEPDVPRV